MSAHHPSVPVFKKNAGIAILLLVVQIVVSYGAAPVLAGDLAFGVKLAVCLGIAILWAVFCVYAGNAAEAGYMAITEMAAHPPVTVMADKRFAREMTAKREEPFPATMRGGLVRFPHTSVA
jgi:hypothetical protein